MFVVVRGGGSGDFVAAVITSLFGGYDRLPEPQIQNTDADWVCFTDQAFKAPEPWRVVVLNERHPAMLYDHPRMRTVWCKTQPWELVDDPTVIWVDANSWIISPRFVAEAGAYATLTNGFATYAHPDRDCIYEEAKASMQIHPKKYHDQPIAEQVDYYRSVGHPEHWGLYAVGTCVYNTTSTRVRDLCDWWLDECEEYSYQTQLSLPYVDREMGFGVDTFRHHQIVGNPWMILRDHLGAS
jgi:hypothetical protein